MARGVLHPRDGMVLFLGRQKMLLVPARLGGSMRRVVVVTLALMIFGPFHAVFAQADDSQKAQARKHFDAGTGLLKVEEFVAAAAEFEESVRLFPTRNGLFNLANAYKGMGRYDKSLKTYERLRTEFGKRIGEEMERKVAQEVRDLKAMRAWLILKVDQPDASIDIDGFRYGKSPLREALVLGAGSHEIKITLDGFEPFLTEVSLLSGDRQTLSVQLVPVEVEAPKEEKTEPEDTVLKPEPEPQPEPAPEPEREPVKKGWSGLRKGGTAFMCIGSTALLGGIMTGITALMIGKGLERDCPDGICTPEKSDEIEGMDNQAIASDVLLGVGGAMFVTGMVMLIVDKKRRNQENMSDVVVAPLAGPSMGGAAITGRF